MHETIENIIRKNLPEKVDDDGFAQDPSVAFNNGFDEALSQITPPKIADEVLKVVGEKIKEEINKISKPDFIRAIRIPVETHYSNRVAECNDIYDEKIDEILQLLSNLSPNKENKNNE